MPTSSFDDLDLAQLRSRGISLDEIQHQLLCFQNPPAYAEVVRPCTVGDGIRTISRSEEARLLDLHARAAAAGRLSKFVPASGAATRMFRSLAWVRASDPPPSWEDLVSRAERDGRAAEVVRLVEEFDRLPFRDLLVEALGGERAAAERLRRHDHLAVVEAMIGEGGPGLADLPKGLIPFHRYEDGETRTSFEEHLVEAALLTRARGGHCRVHFTVSPEHIDGFTTLLRRVGPRYASRFDVAFDVSYSVQKPSTDTIAVDAANRPVRDGEGRIVFRPGGHGALIENLEEVQGDLVLVKNIDNIQRDRDRDRVVRSKALLVGLLVRLQERAFEALRHLKTDHHPEDAALADVESFVQEEFGAIDAREARRGSPRARRDAMIDRLERPIRVCGVVRNTGEPGGGPFWVRGSDGSVTPQIVETAQIDPGSNEQQRVLGRATHFNPVDLVCGLRDASGEPYVLTPLVDPETVLVTRKSMNGRDIKALERPGLWNGAMAGWNTVFVEVDLATFTPVKTVVDLLRPEHQP